MGRALLPIAAWILGALPASAQGWTPVGPPGGDVRSLAADPRDTRLVYLGTTNGILYRSENAGRRWRRTTPGFPLRGMSLDEIAVDPRGRVFVGYWDVAGTGGGVARSSDGGATFTLLEGIAGQSVRALALAPSNPDVLVAGTLSGVFRSENGGESWRRISPEGHAELRNVESVAIDPLDPQVLYAGTWHLAWKTGDGGRSWAPIHAGMINDSDIFTLTVDLRRPTVLYGTACTGIYRSLDAGARWVKVRGIPSSSRRTRAFAQDPGRPEVLFAGTTEGLWASDDGAANWRLLTSKDLVVNAVLVLPDGTLLLGCEGAGVRRSHDGGIAWVDSNDGFSQRFVSRIVFDRAHGRVLVGVLGDRSHGGVFSAADPRGPWTRLALGLEGREVLSLALAGTDLLAGTDDGVFLSGSRDEDWRRLPTTDGFELHPRVADLASPAEGVILAATDRGLLRSGDGGSSWRRLSLGPTGSVSALAIAARDPRLVVAGTPLGLYESRDAGETWSRVSEGLAGTTLRGLAFRPGDDRILFATTHRGLLRSTDLGRTWSRCRSGEPCFADVTGFALDPDGRTLYVGDFGRGGLYRSEDGGETWVAFPTQGLASDRIWAIALDPASPGRILAAGSGGLHLFSPSGSGSAAGSN